MNIWLLDEKTASLISINKKWFQKTIKLINKIKITDSPLHSSSCNNSIIKLINKEEDAETKHGTKWPENFLN